MRAAPAVSVQAGVPASARLVVGLLGLVAAVVSLAWAAAGAGGLRWVVPLASLALTLHLLVELHAVPVRRLRWDGHAWWLRADRAGAEEVRGELTVACDLGRGLLLHFMPDGGRRVGRGDWLPLQRSALDGDWHALRCALYSPRGQRPGAASEALDG